jgi:hypothetical protein
MSEVDRPESNVTSVDALAVLCAQQFIMTHDSVTAAYRRGDLDDSGGPRYHAHRDKRRG